MRLLTYSVQLKVFVLKQAPGPQDGNSAVTETISLAALSLSLSLSRTETPLLTSAGFIHLYNLTTVVTSSPSILACGNIKF